MKMLSTTHHVIFLKNKGVVCFTTFLTFSQESQCLKSVLKVVFCPFVYYQIEEQVLRTRVVVLHIHMIVYFLFSAGNCKEKSVLQGALVEYVPVLSFTVNADISASTSKSFRKEKLVVMA